MCASVHASVCVRVLPFCVFVWVFVCVYVCVCVVFIIAVCAFVCFSRDYHMLAHGHDLDKQVCRRT